ncbi:MAG: serine/threonine-protein kinase [Planctomycetota bacterium]
MEDPSATEQGGRAALSDLVFRFLEACEESTDAPGGLLDALCDEHPALAPKLRSAVQRLSMAGFGMQPTDGAEGDRIVGPYRLTGRLGAGGMGVVHRAVRVDGTGEPIALKLLHPRQLDEPGMRERFAREAEAIQRLDHPGIVRVVDHGEVLEGDVSLPYLAMTYQPGVTLDAFLAAAADADVASDDGRELGALLHAMASTDAGESVATAPPPASLRGPWWQVVARLGAAVASALAHAHERGVVHRDVKPSNLIVTADGRVLLLDFGLASVRDSGRLTRTGAQLGSLPYMAPEQVSGGEVGPAVDVYGLGLVLYELLTLRPAFEPSGWNQVVTQIRRGRTLRPSTEVGFVPPIIGDDLDAIVEQATQPEAKHRIASADALAADLDALVSGERTVARRPGPITRIARVIERNRGRSAAAALAIVLAGGAAWAYAIYEGRLESAAQKSIADEIASIRDTIDGRRSGIVETAIDPLGDDPRFAPSALPRLLDDRARIEEARERLRELAASGEDVEVMAWDADILLSDLLMEIASVHSALGQNDAAIAALRERVDLTGRILEQWRATHDLVPPSLITEHGRSYGMLAREIHLAGLAEPAAEEAARCVEAYDGVMGRTAHPANTTGSLISALMIQTESFVRLGDYASALRTLDRAEAESVRQFGEDPADLSRRGQRAEIELRRVRHGFIEGGRPARIEALLRAAAWFDDAIGAVELNVVQAHIRLDADQYLTRELRRARRFDEALAAAEAYRARCERILALRGASPDSDDPFATELREAEIAVALLRADTGGTVERDAKLATLWDAHERARKEAEERPADVMSLGRYVRKSALYANHAVFEPDAAKWEIERSIEATGAALEASVDAPDIVYAQRRHCLYAHGLALVRAGRLGEAYEAVRELEERGRSAPRDTVDPDAIRQAADLCNELLLRDPDDESLRDRTLDLLDEAVYEGFDDLVELEATESLDLLRDDPRFLDILDRVRARASER